jgi:hypothetical protein
MERKKERKKGKQNSRRKITKADTDQPICILAILHVRG